MLVLTRKVSEAIIVSMSDGRQMEIVVSSVNGSRAKIGIIAPQDVSIVRKELPPREGKK